MFLLAVLIPVLHHDLPGSQIWQAILVPIFGESFAFYLFACLESYAMVPDDYYPGMKIEE